MVVRTPLAATPRTVVMCALLVVVGAAVAGLSARSDLDDLMSEVLARRDDSWSKLQQYILEEREVFQIVGADGVPIFGSRRDYSWFIRQGFFVRSPVRADGVALGDEERRRAEDEWLRRQQRREAERKAEQPQPDRAAPKPSDALAAAAGDVLRQSIEPDFVSAAYFLEFKFDPGRYALAGREQLTGRDVLRVEYYPTKLFTDGRTKPNEKLRDREEDIDRQMNKASLVTLWVDPLARQILKYEFDNVDMEFLPGRSILRIEGMKATMEMGEAFTGVWLPRAVGIRVDVATALGNLRARFDRTYYDYRLATVGTRVR